MLYYYQCIYPKFLFAEHCCTGIVPYSQYRTYLDLCPFFSRFAGRNSWWLWRILSLCGRTGWARFIKALPCLWFRRSGFRSPFQFNGLVSAGMMIALYRKAVCSQSFSYISVENFWDCRKQTLFEIIWKTSMRSPSPACFGLGRSGVNMLTNLRFGFIRIYIYSMIRILSCYSLISEGHVMREKDTKFWYNRTHHFLCWFIIWFVSLSHNMIVSC